ncbi:MAG TPA: DciA family protein [Xanthobacteraceae bacterium]|nr:DciA family protein [Xanthobacteraceae bacterium]
MNKPSRRPYARPLADLVAPVLGDVFARQGFASGEIVTHWIDIAGEDLARLAEPIQLKWPRRREGEPTEPATLVLRVEGPAAIEIQHLAPVLLERVNRFFGWRAVARIAIRQAPLARKTRKARPDGPTPAEMAAVKAGLDGIADDGLREALARLGAALKSRAT